jgi:CHAT domain-containing protein/tetratricopeptide (TPR) repeat protein
MSTMVSQEWFEQLLATSDTSERRRILRAHADVLDDQVARALKKQADQFLRADISRSLATAGLLVALADYSGDPTHRALGLLAEANARSIGLGQYERALALYDEAASIYHNQDRLLDQAKSQVGKVGTLALVGRYQDAEATGQWAARILEDHQEWIPLATLVMNLAIMYARRGKDTQALDLFDRAGALYAQLGEEGESGWSWVQLNRAYVLRNLGRFEASIEASRTAAELLDRLGQTVAAARAEQMLSLTFFVLGRYNEALDRLDHVRDVYLEDGRQRDAMLVELFISDCLLQLRRFSDVLEKCHQVRRHFAQLGTPRVVAQAIINEAVAYAELGRHGEALDSLAEARQIFEAEGNQTWVASTDLERSAVLMQQGRLEESLETAQACARVFASYQLPIEEAQALLVAARAAIPLGHCEMARQLVSRVLAEGQERNIPTLTYQAHYLLGTLSSAQDDLPAALAAYERAIRDMEQIRGRLMVEFRVGFLEDKAGLYEEAVDLCLNLERPLQGLELAERAKSRALLDLLAHRLDLSIEAREAEDQPLVEELLHLRARRDRLYRRWESDGESSERGWTTSGGDRGQAQQEVLALEKQITDLWHRLLVRNADYARDAALWTVRTEPVQPYLDPDTLLVEYFVVHGQLIVFLVTAKEIKVQRLECDLKRVERLIQLFWLNLRSVPKSPIEQIATLESNARGLLQRLYGLLLSPLEANLAGYQKLIIVPHDALHYLPFHALYDGTVFMLERYEISYLPAASFLRYCQAGRETPSGMLAVGYSHGQRLPHTLTEARTVAELLGGQVLLEDQASTHRLRQVAPACRTLHVAAHGDFRPDNPLFSGLALADGWLTTLDIFNMRLNASLVTLSACQTGRNVVGGGDELLGLMRAFLCAGAASLALSLWAVEDRSTAQLMEVFYSRLAQGRTKGAALRAAQLRFVRNGNGEGRYKHPYYWAAFFLVGDAGSL